MFIPRLQRSGCMTAFSPGPLAQAFIFRAVGAWIQHSQCLLNCNNANRVPVVCRGAESVEHEVKCAWEILHRLPQTLLAIEHEIKVVTFPNNAKRWVFYFRPQLLVVQPFSLAVYHRPRLKRAFARENPLDPIPSGPVE